jgi:flagellar hook-associated protein 3 FlgL
MRITQAEMSRNLLADIRNLNESLNEVSRQISSGKKVTQLKDSPSGSAQLVSMTELQSDYDQYRSNVETGSYFLGVAESALNEVNNLVTSAYTKGSAATSETASADTRSALAVELRSMRDQIVTLANTEIKGTYIFAGTDVADAPYVQNGDLITYRGNNEVNTVIVGKGLEMQQSVAGSAVFASIFSSIDGLLAGIDGNDITAIKDSLSQFSSAMTELQRARGKIGTGLSMIQNVKTTLDLQENTLKEQRGLIEATDLSEAVVRFKELQTGLQAALTAGGSMLSQRNLFDILG